jgi:hypothetical protein
MDYGFLAIAVLVFLLNDGLAVGSFVLLYDWPVAIMRLANRDASAARPGMNFNVVGKGWRGNANHNGSSNQIFLHVSLLHLWDIEANVGARRLVPKTMRVPLHLYLVLMELRSTTRAREAEISQLPICPRGR